MSEILSQNGDQHTPKSRKELLQGKPERWIFQLLRVEPDFELSDTAKSSTQTPSEIQPSIEEKEKLKNDYLDILATFGVSEETLPKRYSYWREWLKTVPGKDFKLMLSVMSSDSML